MEGVESADFWVRKHRTGNVATVQRLTGKRHYLAGAPSGAAISPYMELPTLGDAMRYADIASDCPQPCHCPDWAKFP